MPTDFHTPLTAADIAEINAAVRAFPVPLSERQSIANDLGLSERTVSRWFTEAGQQVNIIPATLEGFSPQEIAEHFTDELANRVMIGLLYSGGASGDLFSKKDYTRTDTRETPIEVAERLRLLAMEKFHKYSIKEFTFTRIEGGFQINHVWTSPDYGEYEEAYLADLADDTPLDMDDEDLEAGDDEGEF